MVIGFPITMVPGEAAKRGPSLCLAPSVIEHHWYLARSFFQTDSIIVVRMLVAAHSRRTYGINYE